MLPHCSLVGSVQESWEAHVGDGFSELESSAWLPELFSFFPIVPLPAGAYPHMHHAACAGQCINPSLHLEY